MTHSWVAIAVAIQCTVSPSAGAIARTGAMGVIVGSPWLSITDHGRCFPRLTVWDRVRVEKMRRQHWLMLLIGITILTAYAVFW